MNEDLLLKVHRTPHKDSSTFDSKSPKIYQPPTEKPGTYIQQDRITEVEPSEHSSDGDFWMRRSETSPGKSLK